MSKFFKALHQPVLAKKVHKSPRTVNRLINYLARMSYLAIGRTGRANVYMLNPNLIWRSYGYRKKYVLKYIHFPTNTVLARSQNLKLFKTEDSYIKKYGRKYIDFSKVHQEPIPKPQVSSHKKSASKMGSKAHSTMSNNILRTAKDTINSIKADKLHLSPRYFEVYTFIIKHMKHYRLNMNGKQIYCMMHKGGSHIGQQTIWRTLSSLKKLLIGKNHKPLLRRKRYGDYGRKSCLLINPEVDNLTNHHLINVKKHAIIKQLEKRIDRNRTQNKIYSKRLNKKQPLNYNQH